MKNVYKLNIMLIFGIIIFFILPGCIQESGWPSNSSDETLVISPSDYRIRFIGNTWSSVVFEHKEHSDRQDSDCFECHNCADFVGESHWNCRECHSPSDPEGLCLEDQDHGCVMTQCKFCHEDLGVNPGLTCIDCHTDGLTLDPDPPGGPPTVIFNGLINSQSRVDHWAFTLSNTCDLIIDVEAWESCGAKPNIPTDFFDNGESNDRLTSNIYLFTSTGVLIGSSTGMYPGDSAPGAHDTRSGVNPYLSLNNLSAGEYILAIGAYELSQADAWAGTNTAGSSWFATFWDGTPNYNNYRINVYCQN